jgi:hypothetical protein
VALKYAIDDLTHHRFPGTSIILFGVFRFGGELLVEFRTMLFASVRLAVLHVLSP